MHEIPVSIHEKIIAELTPAMDQLRDLLCEPLPTAGSGDIVFFSSWLSEFGKQSESVVATVDVMGNAILQCESEKGTGEMLYSVHDVAEAIRKFGALREQVMDAEFEVRSILLAMIDSVMRDILSWFGQYRGIVLHPEAWQGKEIELNLILDIAEESEALHRFLVWKEGAEVTPPMYPHQEGIGMLGLLAAFGLGLWFGDDD